MSDPKFLAHVMDGRTRPPSLAKKLADITPALADLKRLEVELSHRIELDTTELLRQQLKAPR